jgi:hypothetical protein
MHIEYSNHFTFNPCAGCGPAPNVVNSTFGILWPSVDVANLDVLVSQLNSISNYCTVLVRPHPNPRYTNCFERYRHLLKAQVSDAYSEDIHCFIDRCSLLAGNLSSVLVKAASRGREVIYLHDAYLASLRTYHKYYQNVEMVHVEELDKYVCGRVTSRMSQ